MRDRMTGSAQSINAGQVGKALTGADETLFLVRTRGFPEMARLLATTLASAGVDVAIVVDEQDGPVDCDPFPKISLDEAALAPLGLQDLPRNWRWMCGDMCYYLAAKMQPDYARYVMVESDVFLPPLGVDTLVHSLSTHPAQAIAARFGKNKDRRRFSNMLVHFDVDPQWGCIFPLTAVTPPVITAMKEIRLQQMQDLPDATLNDEAVLAGAVVSRGISYARLEDVIPERVPEETFSTNPPHLFEAVRANPDERRLFHPVVPFETILARLENREKAYNRRRLRNVLQTAPRPMRRILRQRLQAKE